MKQVILKILRTVYAKTKRYSVTDLENYCWILKGLFKESDYEENVITCNDNPFWNYENNQNRSELISAFYGFSKKGMTTIGNTKFTIYNRFINGDKYGIDEITKKESF